MAFVHIRVATGRRFGEQHPDNDQSGRKFVAVRRQSAAGPGHGSGAQLGLQGGKNRGLYYFGIFTILIYL